MSQPQPWIKLWVEARTDRKLDRLTDAQYRVWCNLLMFASEQEDRGTFADGPDSMLEIEVAKGNRKKLTSAIAAMLDLHILNDLGGGRYAFHAFEERQSRKPSDTPEMARERKRRQREREAEQARIDAGEAMSRPVTPLSRPVTRDAVTCHAEVEVEEEVEVEKKDINPVSSWFPEPERIDRGASVEAKSKDRARTLTPPQRAYFTAKVGRTLTSDEQSSIARLLTTPDRVTGEVFEQASLAAAIEEGIERGKGFDIGYAVGCLRKWSAKAQATA